MSNRQRFVTTVAGIALAALLAPGSLLTGA